MTKILIALTTALVVFAPNLLAAEKEAEQPDKFLLLATSRTGTMPKEMNEAPPEYEFAGMTVFESRFGGSEAAVILQAESKEE